MPLTHWNDGRLDDLKQDVDALRDVPATLATLTTEMAGLRREMKTGFERMETGQTQERKVRREDSRHWRTLLFEGVAACAAVASAVGLIVHG